MKRTLLIINAYSGNAKAVDAAEVVAALHVCGLNVAERISIPDGDLPDPAWLDDRQIGVVAIISGDGTISSLSQQLCGWSGEILALPGGTMNLLSRRLHGELTLPQLIAQIGSAQFESSSIPIVCVGNREVFTGLTVGPSTRWGQVREGMRQGDVAGLVQAVPEAWSETLSDDGVWIEGQPREAYAGVFVEPYESGLLSVIGFRANNIGDMVGHGVAWLRRDFRDGPKDDFGAMPEVAIIGDNAETGILIDGEYEDGRLPLTCTAGMSSMKFLRMK